MSSIINSPTQPEPTASTGNNTAASVPASFDFLKDYPKVRKPRKNSTKATTEPAEGSSGGQPAESSKQAREKLADQANPAPPTMSAEPAHENHSNSATAENTIPPNQGPLAGRDESSVTSDASDLGVQVGTNSQNDNRDQGVHAGGWKKENADVSRNTNNSSAPNPTIQMNREAVFVPGNAGQMDQEQQGPMPNTSSNTGTSTGANLPPKSASEESDPHATQKRSTKRKGKKSTGRVQKYREKQRTAKNPEISFFIGEQFTEAFQKSASVKGLSVHGMARQIVEEWIQSQMSTGFGSNHATQTPAKS